MQSLVEFLCFTLLVSYLQAAADNPRSPKLGPTIAEKPFKIDEDLALILNVINNKLIAERIINPLERINSKGNVNDILTLNGMDQKKLTVKNLIDLLTSRTYKQRMQLSATYQNKTQNTQNSLPSLLQNSFGPLFNGLFMDMKALLGIYVQNSLDRAKDWAYMSILCTSSASQLQMLKDYQFTYKPNPVDSKTWKQVTLDEFIHKAMNHYSGKKVLSTIINADPLRPDSGVDQSKFKKQLKAIPNLGTDCVPLNNHLLDLMAKESFDHIKAVDDEYRSKHDGKTILGQIDQHCSGDMKEAYRRIVSYAVDPFGYFADEIQAGLTDPNKGWIHESPNIAAHTRCEVDLKDIEAAYHVKYNKTLLEVIKNWSSPSDNAVDNDLKNAILYGVFNGNTGNCP